MSLALLLSGCTSPMPSTPTVIPAPPTEDLEVIEVPVAPCEEPSTGPGFDRQLLPFSPIETEPHVYGGGVVAEDFDGDGIHEIITVRDGRLEYLDWDGTTWAERAGLPQVPMELGFGGVVADVDADGDLDVFVTRWGASNHLLLNDGSGVFEDATAAYGLAGPPLHHSTSATFADIDGDGDLDLFVGGHGHLIEGGSLDELEPPDPSLIYTNDNGAFVDASALLPPTGHDGYTFIPGLIDLDGDLDPDLLLANDFGIYYERGHLAWNHEGSFVLDDNAAGFDLQIGAMGLAWAELNGDGVPDALVPYWSSYRFMKSAGTGWVDFSEADGLKADGGAVTGVAWGAMFGDLDNDGREDAVVMHGHLVIHLGPNGSPNAELAADQIFRQREDGTFMLVNEVLGISDVGANRGVVVADFDGDGWLDWARPDLTGPTAVYMNRCRAEAFLEIDLEQGGDNPNAVGAVIVVTAGEDTHTRYVLAGGEGYGSSRPFEQHFGLGAQATVGVTITWPDGVVTELTDVATRRRIRVSRSR